MPNVPDFDIRTPAPRLDGKSYQISAWRKVRRLVLVNLVSFGLIGLLGELGFRLLWNPKYWVSCDRWLIGSGQTRAGKKWWPETTYLIESKEFCVRFRTNSRGYRARPAQRFEARPYRIAFVGDSFTEAMQVEYDKSFVALLERALTGAVSGRDVVCENYGIAATGLFDYWHRTVHDVLKPSPPDALVLCIYPGNDFSIDFPDEAFDAQCRPRTEYFREPSRLRHAITWLNLKSRFASFLLKSMRTAAMRAMPAKEQGPDLWWVDPALAASAADKPAVRRSRAVITALDEECRRSGTRLCVLVVGPVLTYSSKDGRSPLRQILAAWKVDVPVIDVALEAIARPDFPTMLFPRDGHLNEPGHAYVASRAAEPLRAVVRDGAMNSVVSR
jgi:hypothetical protein